MSDNIEVRMLKRLDQWDRLAAQARALFEERNRGYRDAVRHNGVMGVLFEFTGIAGRLRALRDDLLRAHYTPDDEQGWDKVYNLLRDKIMDMVIYGLIALMLLEDDNILGEE